MKKIILDGYVGWDFTAITLRDMLPIDESEVLIHVNSAGGNLFDGLEIFSVIKSYPGVVNLSIGALAGSAASIFPIAADNVIVTPISTMMIHKVLIPTFGNADEHFKMGKLLNDMDTLLVGLYATATGQKKEKILADLKEETYLIGGQAIVDYGFATEVSDGSPIENVEAVREEIEDMIQASHLTAVNAGYKFDPENAASILGDFKAIVNPKGGNVMQAFADIFKPLNVKNKEKPSATNKPIVEEASMNLSEFLASNPDAQAMYDQNIAAAVSAAVDPEAQASTITEAVAGERARVTSLLNVSHIEVTPALTAAIDSDQSAGEFAISAMAALKTAPKSNAAELKNIAPTLEPKATAPKTTNSLVAQAKNLAAGFKKRA